MLLEESPYSVDLSYFCSHPRLLLWLPQHVAQVPRHLLCSLALDLLCTKAQQPQMGVLCLRLGLSHMLTLYLKVL